MTKGDLRGIELDAWRESLRVRVKLLHRHARAVDGQAFLVSATRLGGLHGYDDAGAVAPLGGAVTGFTKAYKRERPEALVKAVDFGAGARRDGLADLLIEETLRDPGAVEIGYRDGQRWTVGLQEQPAETGGPAWPWTRNRFRDHRGSRQHRFGDHRRSGGSLRRNLLSAGPSSRAGSAQPRPRALRHGKEGLKRDMFERMKARGERATPALVEKEMPPWSARRPPRAPSTPCGTPAVRRITSAWT